MTGTSVQAEEDRVLIIDDEERLTDIYMQWLSDQYQVETACDGREGLSKLDDEIDVVLLDRRMPNLSGDEVLEHIREKEYQVKVAVVSAVDPDFDVIGMGFDEYLVKPVKKDGIQEVVDRLLNRTDYEENTEDLSQLLATKAVLEQEKQESELEANMEYLELQQDIYDLQKDVDETLDGFTHEDYLAAFRDIDVKNGS
ncbi:HoxA transcriptional regulator [Natrinema sp. CBA1119]|uniref:response regulator n=1 Tax=Natrinema sp. CBA1119 TaxID=1608465 RepID=UPI000BFA8154|nr:response regulator [Natrinema sp. CBA1119]PGF17242.1 HoxA transcriptional regulator [Natrinema sp. CBA1119]